jgi:hypothetical protein
MDISDKSDDDDAEIERRSELKKDYWRKSFEYLRVIDRSCLYYYKQTSRVYITIEENIPVAYIQRRSILLLRIQINTTVLG